MHLIIGNMGVASKGVGPRLEKKYPKALYFLCASHQLNRVIVTSCRIRTIENMMGTFDKVWNFFYVIRLQYDYYNYWTLHITIYGH